MAAVRPKLAGYQEHNYWQDFKSLSFGHKVLTILTGIIAGIPSFGIGAYFAARSLIGRFKKIEDTKKLTLQNANRVDQAATEVLPRPRVPTPSPQDPVRSDASEIEVSPTPEESTSPEESATTEESSSSEEMAPEKSVEQETPAVADTAQPTPAQNVVKKTGVTPELKEKLDGLFWHVISSESFKKNYYPKKLDVKNANEIIDAFVVFQAIKLGRFNLGPDFRRFLIGRIHATIGNVSAPKSASIKFPYRFSDTKEVDRLPTKGRGSCGFHALLGDFDDEGLIACNEKKVRNLFCERLQAMYDNKDGTPKMLEPIGAMLYDLYMKSTLYDTSLNEAIKNIREEYDEILEKGTLDIYECQEAFSNDPRVFKAYIKHLRKPEVYIDQPELEAAAIIFNKRVRLFQQGWGNESHLLKEAILNPDGEDEVCIYYTPQDKHYERATVTAPQKSR